MLCQQVSEHREDSCVDLSWHPEPCQWNHTWISDLWSSCGERIEEDAEGVSWIIDDADDTLSDHGSKLDNVTPDPTDSGHDTHELTAPSNINGKGMVERQQKMIDFLVQHNTKQLVWHRSMTIDSRDKGKMRQPKRYCQGARELSTYLSALWLNFGLRNTSSTTILTGLNMF